MDSSEMLGLFERKLTILVIFDLQKLCFTHKKKNSSFMNVYLCMNIYKIVGSNSCVHGCCKVFLLPTRQLDPSIPRWEPKSKPFYSLIPKITI